MPRHARARRRNADTASPARPSGPLAEADSRQTPWRDWGPYLSERAWGTVREDYSADGDAWAFFPHDHARSRVYRWNEDGMAGLLRRDAELVPVARAVERRRPDPQGADVRADRARRATTARTSRSTGGTSTARPTHSWNTWRYHYPQRAFPYGDLVAENARRGKLEPEYELVDTGIFDDDRYWVVTVDYAKAGAARPADADHRRERRAGRGDPARAADAVVPQHLVVGVRPTTRSRRCGWTATGSSASHSESGPLVLVGDGDAGAAVLRERDQHRAAVRRPATSRRTRRTASTTTSCTAPRTVNPAQRGHQGRAALHGDGAGRRIRRRSGCGWSACRTRRSTSTRLAPSVAPIDARPAGSTP